MQQSWTNQASSFDIEVTRRTDVFGGYGVTRWGIYPELCRAVCVYHRGNATWLRNKPSEHEQMQIMIPNYCHLPLFLAMGQAKWAQKCPEYQDGTWWDLISLCYAAQHMSHLYVIHGWPWSVPPVRGICVETRWLHWSMTYYARDAEAKRAARAASSARASNSCCWGKFVYLRGPTAKKVASQDFRAENMAQSSEAERCG